MNDPEKREIYDQYGEDALKEGMGGGGGGGHNPFDIFESFFGGNPFGGGMHLIRTMSFTDLSEKIQYFYIFYGYQVVEVAEAGGKEGERMLFILSRFPWMTCIMEHPKSYLFRAMCSAPNARGEFAVSYVNN